MAASVFDSQIYSRLFATGEMGKLFTDSAEVRAMMLVEGALAKAQGELGVIPETAGAILQDEGVLTDLRTALAGVWRPWPRPRFRGAAGR